MLLQMVGKRSSLEDKVTDFQVGFSRCKLLNEEICEPNLDSSTVLISTEIYILYDII